MKTSFLFSNDNPSVKYGVIVVFTEVTETFAIERINSAAILDEKYTIPKNWSPENIILDK